jgi:hypothetical protein
MEKILQQERRDQVRGGRRPRQQDVVGASDPAGHRRGPEGKADLHWVRINCAVVHTRNNPEFFNRTVFVILKQKCHICKPIFVRYIYIRNS